MAPLTRCRATPEGVPTDLMQTYYKQRATDAGLIITEATIVHPIARGYPCTPGIHSAEQVEAWKPIVKETQVAGSRLFCQLWHQGRTASQQLTNLTPVAPSALEFVDGMGNKAPVPRALETHEIKETVEMYRTAAKFALQAGFDGIEIHGANGYLPNQFLCDGSNKRTDEYGGSIENRARFLMEVTQVCIDIMGADKVGVRISPASHWQDIYDSDPIALYTYVGKELGKLNIAYLHVVEPRDTGFGATKDPVDSQLTANFFRTLGYPGPILSAGGHDGASGEEYIKENKADAIVYGRWYISNPDLSVRFAKGAALNPYDRSTFYGGGENGYITYKRLDE